jgi:hypothetical protein
LNQAPSEADAPPPTPGRAWLLLPCLPVGIAGSLILFLGVADLGAPRWFGAVVALVFFPILPVAWHLLAERQRRGPAVPGRPLERFALRTLVVGLTVLSVSLATRGPRRIGADLHRVLRGQVVEAPAPPAGTTPASPARAAPPPPPAPRARHELEPFIPADARMVVALSDPGSLKRLFALVGADTNKRLSALDTCQIPLARARVLIAVRDRKTRMIVVRSPGVVDKRNLYCLVGFLGSDKLSLRFTGGKGPVRFEIDGFLPRALKFESVDDQTIVASDPAWRDTVDQKLFGPPPTATPAAGVELARVLERVDRGANLWAAGVVDGAPGPWDFALEGRADGPDFILRASSRPPSGPEEARFELRVPAKFSAALPEGAIDAGLRALLAVLAVAGPSPSPARPAAPAARPARGDSPDTAPAPRDAP